MRLFLLLSMLLGSVPAIAADAVPSVQEKLAYLGNYSLALGRKFGCDGKSDEMVFDIKRYTYVLQFEDADGTAAQDIAKKNLTTGITETKANRGACPATKDELDKAETAARDNRSLMLAAGHNVALVAGAAMQCDLPDTDVQQMLKSGLDYTHNDSAGAKSSVAGWVTEGRQEVTAKRIGCDAVKGIFGQLKTIFTQ